MTPEQLQEAREWSLTLTKAKDYVMAKGLVDEVERLQAAYEVLKEQHGNSSK